MVESVFEELKNSGSLRKFGKTLSNPLLLAENLAVSTIAVSGITVAKFLNIFTSTAATILGQGGGQGSDEVGKAILVKEVLMEQRRLLVEKAAEVSGFYTNQSYGAKEVGAKDNLKDDLKSQTLDDLAYSVQKLLTEKSWDKELTRLEGGLNEEAMHRFRDAVLFSNIHLWLNWDAETNAMANTSYNWNKELDTVGKALGKEFEIKKESNPTRKAFKHLVVPTERLTLRAVNDSFDFIPMVFNSFEQFTFFNLLRAGKLIVGSIFGSETRMEKATAIVYGDLTKDATNKQVGPDYESSLYFQYVRDKFSDTSKFVLQLLERQTEIGRILNDPSDPKHELIKNLKSPISSYQLGTKNVREPKNIKIFGFKVATVPGKEITKPVFDYFTYGELYKNGFSQEIALKTVQAEYHNIMQDLAKIGRIKSSGGTIFFTQFMNTLVNYVNNMNEVKGSNTTGLKFFDLGVERGEIPKTQKVWNIDEEKFLLTMVANMVHGSTPGGVDNFQFANPNLVSNDPKKVNAGFAGTKYKDAYDFLDKKASTELSYALCVPEVPRGTVKTEFTETVFNDKGYADRNSDGTKKTRVLSDSELQVPEHLAKRAEKLVAELNIKKKINLLAQAEEDGIDPRNLLKTQEEVVLSGAKGGRNFLKAALGVVIISTGLLLGKIFFNNKSQPDVDKYVPETGNVKDTNNISVDTVKTVIEPVIPPVDTASKKVVKDSVNTQKTTPEKVKTEEEKFDELKLDGGNNRKDSIKKKSTNKKEGKYEEMKLDGNSPTSRIHMQNVIKLGVGEQQQGVV